MKRIGVLVSVLGVFVGGIVVADDAKAPPAKVLKGTNGVKVIIRAQGPYDADVPLQVVCYFKHKTDGDRTLGAAVALLPDDLGERAMLGDAGANALGAMLGAAAASSLSRRSRLAILAGVTALTAASEVVSFTTVIQRTPPLHWLDMLGRRPAHAAPSPGRAAAAAPRVTVPAQGGPYAASAEGSSAERSGHDTLAAPHSP